MVPRPDSSLNPCCFPAVENGWHGKPAKYKSTSGMLATRRCVISGCISMGEKFAFNVLRTFESLSLLNK